MLISWNQPLFGAELPVEVRLLIHESPHIPRKQDPLGVVVVKWAFLYD